MIAQLIEFGSRHSELLAAALVVTGLLAGLELYRRAIGSKSLSPTQAALFMNRENPIIIDIRDIASFSKAHLPAARHIPYTQLSAALKKLKMKRPILIIADGNDALYKVARQLHQHGFTQLYHLEGGIRAWQQADLPLAQ